MKAEDCYEIHNLNKKTHLTKKKVRRKLQKSPPPPKAHEQPSRAPNCCQPSSTTYLKNIVEAQQEMCKAMLQISHKMLQISCPPDRKPQPKREFKKSRSLGKPRLQCPIKSSVSCKEAKLMPSQLSNIEEVKEDEEAHNSGHQQPPLNKSPVLTTKSLTKEDPIPYHHRYNDYFVVGMVKNPKRQAFDRSKSTSRVSVSSRDSKKSRRSKVSSVTSVKTCLSSMPTDHKETLRPSKSVLNIFRSKRKGGNK